MWKLVRHIHVCGLFFYTSWVQSWLWKVSFLYAHAGILLDQRNKASASPPQHLNLSKHENKSSHRAVSLPRALPPLRGKLFDQFDLFKQNTALCVFRANFPLHRWRISVYFSFVFNGRPFRHWTRGPSSSHALRSLVASLFLWGDSPDGEGKRLEVEVVLSLNMILWLLKLLSVLLRAGCLTS